MPGDARDPERRVRRARAASARLDLLRERRRHALVGVERQNPVVARERRRVVLLRDVAGPLADDDAIGVPPRDRDGVVGALRVDDDDLVGPGDRLRARRRCPRLRSS